MASPAAGANVEEAPPASPPPKTPTKWPQQVKEHFEPVKELGKGGFGMVMLAKRIKNVEQVSDAERIEALDPRKRKIDKNLVAMKVVGGVFTDASDGSSRRLTLDKAHIFAGYAHREIEILRHLDHVNIRKLVQYWEGVDDDDDDDETTNKKKKKRLPPVIIMALQYAPGPTLYELLHHGGKLSWMCCRVLSAQLIDTVSYLHSRAVLHRDLKPDNLIIRGGELDQDELWNDAYHLQSNDSEINWNALLSKWHLTLIDFGLARALKPSDFEKGRKLQRSMSAVGNKTYSAPEVQKGIQQVSRDKRKDYNDITSTLADYVSEYGMEVDAYSVGVTLTYMMTGVRPDKPPPPKEQSGGGGGMLRRVFGRSGGTEQQPAAATDSSVTSMDASASDANSSFRGKRRIRQYRTRKQIPRGPILRLVDGLTSKDPLLRMTIQKARSNPWIDKVLPDNYSSVSSNKKGRAGKEELQFLECVLPKEGAVVGTSLSHEKHRDSSTCSTTDTTELVGLVA